MALDDCTGLSRPWYRHVAFRHREPTSLEALLTLERADVEHTVDLVDRERADRGAPETGSVTPDHTQLAGWHTITHYAWQS